MSEKQTPYDTLKKPAEASRPAAEDTMIHLEHAPAPGDPGIGSEPAGDTEPATLDDLRNHDGPAWPSLSAKERRAVLEAAALALYEIGQKAGNANLAGIACHLADIRDNIRIEAADDRTAGHTDPYAGDPLLGPIRLDRHIIINGAKWLAGRLTGDGTAALMVYIARGTRELDPVAVIEFHDIRSLDACIDQISRLKALLEASANAGAPLPVEDRDGESRMAETFGVEP